RNSDRGIDPRTIQATWRNVDLDSQIRRRIDREVDFALLAHDGLVCDPETLIRLQPALQIGALKRRRPAGADGDAQFHGQRPDQPPEEARGELVPAGWRHDFEIPSVVREPGAALTQVPAQVFIRRPTDVV